MILFGNISKGLEEYRKTSGAVLVDVREADEFATGHIPGAVNAPLSAIRGAALPKAAPCSFTACGEAGAGGRRAY